MAGGGESWGEASGSSVVTFLPNNSQSRVSSSSNFCFSMRALHSIFTKVFNRGANNQHMNMTTTPVGAIEMHIAHICVDAEHNSRACLNKVGIICFC
jgi:hypothetical protein